MAKPYETEMETDETLELGPDDPQKKQKLIQDSQKPGALADKLRTSPETIEDLRSLANDPQYQTDIPPSQRQSLQEAISKAESLYAEKTNRNDWLEVAQTLGNALAQYGAARSGAGVISPGPGINYQGRNERANQEFNRSVGIAKDLGQADRQEYEDKFKNTQTEYGKKKDFYNTELSTIMKKEGEDFTADRDDKRYDKDLKVQDLKSKDTQNKLTSQENSLQSRLNTNERIADKRIAASERNSQRSADRMEKTQSTRTDQSELKDLQSQEKSLSERINNAQAVVNDLAATPNVSKKEKDKVRARLGERAGKAGIDLSAAIDYVDNAPKKPASGIRGVFGGKDVDSAGTSKGLEQVTGLSSLKKELSELQNRKKAILQKNGPASSTSTVKASSSSQGTAKGTGVNDKVMVTAPNGQKGMIPRSQLDSALKQGYTESK